MKHSQLPKLLAFVGIMIFTLVMAVFFWSTGPANSIDLDEGEMPSARANSADPSVEEDSDPEVTSVREEQQETQNPNQSKAQRQPASSVRESVTANSVAAFFETQGGGQWQVRTTDDGEVFRVIGGEVKEIGKSGESIRSFMMSLAPELGISAEQVDGLPEADSTRNLLIYDSVPGLVSHSCESQDQSRFCI